MPQFLMSNVAAKKLADKIRPELAAMFQSAIDDANDVGHEMLPYEQMERHTLQANHFISRCLRCDRAIIISISFIRGTHSALTINLDGAARIYACTKE